MLSSAAGRSPGSPLSSRDSRYPSRRRITLSVNMAEIGVPTSSVISTFQTPQLINGSTRQLSRIRPIRSPSETLHVTSQLSVRPATRTGTCRFRSTGTSERSPGCSSGLRCTTHSIERTSTLPISIRDQAQRSAQLATPSQPEIHSSGSNFSGEKGFSVDISTSNGGAPAGLRAPDPPSRLIGNCLRKTFLK